MPAKKSNAPAGYSGTPLVKKLGVRDGAKMFLDNAPENYMKLVRQLPAGATVQRRLSAGADFVHVFATSKKHLRKALRLYLAKLAPDGAIWVSWPKKSSNVPTEVTENTVREIALPLGLVDIKVCAIDDTWSGLKLVIRKALREKSSAPGQRRS